jgi:uncharacterized protein
MTNNTEFWIRMLGLIKHPEGGYYRESYRADLTIASDALPPEYTGARVASTAIYFLLDGESFSAFHRIRSDELWHFYEGGSLTLHVIAPGGEYQEAVLGRHLEAGERLQAVVKGGCWFAAKVRDRDSFSVVGCTVAPGFDFQDFELGKRSQLLERYPQHRQLIERLTRE